MNKTLFRSLALTLAMSLTLPAWAQEDEIDTTFEFVDSEGKVVPDGSIVTINKAIVEDDGFGGIYTMMPCGLYVHNTDDDASLLVNYNLKRIDSGSFQICFPSTCISKSDIGTYKTSGGTLKADETRNLQTEWLPDDYGQCEAHLQIVFCVGFNNQFEEIVNGPAITLRFVYADPAGVQSAMQVVRPVARYALDGTSLRGAKHGIQLVRYSDGTVRKVVQK